MTATSIVPKTCDLPTGITQWYENSEKVLSYLLFYYLLILLAWWFFFLLEEVLSTSSPFTSHKHHITCTQTFPALLKSSATLHLSEVKNSSWPCLVYQLLYYFSLLVVIKIQMSIYHFLKGGWVLWEPTLQPKLSSAGCALMPSGLKNNLFGLPTHYISVLSRCRMQDFSLWRIPSKLRWISRRLISQWTWNEGALYGLYFPHILENNGHNTC